MYYKKSFYLTAIIFTITTMLFASSLSSSSNKVDWQKAEKNYLKALTSENQGVRQSAASHIGEYKFKGAVPILVLILQTDRSVYNRMAAALALVLIGEEEGKKAVEEASIYDGSEKVAEYCAQILNTTIQEHN